MKANNGSLTKLIDLQQKYSQQQNEAINIDTVNQLIQTNFDRFKQLEQMQMAHIMEKGSCNAEKVYLTLLERLQ